jgi:hypothetical protein
MSLRCEEPDRWLGHCFERSQSKLLRVARIRKNLPVCGVRLATNQGAGTDVSPTHPDGQKGGQKALNVAFSVFEDLRVEVVRETQRPLPRCGTVRKRTVIET